MGSFFEENTYVIVIAVAAVAIVLVASLNENFILGAFVGAACVFFYQSYQATAQPCEKFF